MAKDNTQLIKLFGTVGDRIKRGNLEYHVWKNDYLDSQHHLKTYIKLHNLLEEFNYTRYNQKRKTQTTC